MTRNIPGVGSMRIRYPVMPLHEQGSSMYKDIQALSDMTLKRNKYISLYPDAKLDNGTIQEVSFKMIIALNDRLGYNDCIEEKYTYKKIRVSKVFFLCGDKCCFDFIFRFCLLVVLLCIYSLFNGPQ